MRAILRTAGPLALAVLFLTLGTSSRALTAGSDPACTSGPTDLGDLGVVASWMLGLQYGDPTLPSDGAIKVHHTAGYVDPSGRAYFDVTPYNANLAVLGLLRAPVQGNIDAAAGWIRWYLGHLNADGTIYDHWYLADGTGETTCPLGLDPAWCNYEDSSDSYAATFLAAVWAYYQAGGDPSLLREHRTKLERVTGVLLALQQQDGLTWAKDDFRVKFVFNNSEVYGGLASMASMETAVFGDRGAGQRYDTAARKVGDGIGKSLFNRRTGLYRVAKFEDGTVQEANLDIWYPGTVAVAWPHLFGVIAGDSSTALAQMNALNASWDGSPNPDWTKNIVDPAGFPWPSIGYAAFLVGDCTRARAHVELVRAEKFPNFDYPFTVDDGGWLLRTLSGFAGLPAP